MGDWTEKNLGDVCTLQRGFDLPKRLREEGDVPLVSSSGVIDSHSESRVCGPGVVTGRSGSIGNVYFITEDFWPLNTVLYVKDFHGNDERFVYYLLSNFDLGKYASGAGVPTLNRNAVHSVPVKIPSSVSDQRLIAERLDRSLGFVAEAMVYAEKKLDALRDLRVAILHKAFTDSLRS